MYIIKDPQFKHKRHLNQLRRRISNEADSSPSEETVADIIYDTFNITTPLASASLRGPSLIGGDRFIAWCQRRPFFRGMPTGSEAFLGILGYGPAPGPTKKRPCAILVRLVGRKTNNNNLQATWQYQNDVPNRCITPVFSIFVLLL